VTCYHPLTAYKGRKPKSNGKSAIYFKMQHSDDEQIELPCGQCIGCRLAKSRDWAVRCVHEAELHEQNMFLTLTFDDDSLRKRDNPLSVDKKEFQKFMKRYRKMVSDLQLRYFHCGEYGEVCSLCGKSKVNCHCGPIEEWNERKQLGRPHYHAIIFGHEFDDKVLHGFSGGMPIYTSATLSKLWPFGFCTIGDVTFDSAAYVARYITKKINGDAAAEHYKVIDHDTGELVDVEPEYITMSRGRAGKGKGGIGALWFDRFGSDVYPHDFVVIDGKKFRPPKYYDRVLDDFDPHSLEVIKDKRKQAAIKQSRELSTERLAAKERYKQIQAKKLLRTL
jgi:hypothetical protein